jgi:hypothetical protein
VHILAEDYAGAMEPAVLHLLMSVSKSVVGILAGALVGEGALNVEEQSPCTYRLERSGYRGATVRHCSTCAQASPSQRITWTRRQVRMLLVLGLRFWRGRTPFVGLAPPHSRAVGLQAEKPGVAAEPVCRVGA